MISCAPIAPGRSNPENPFIRGTAQNPDTFFQAREAVEPRLRPHPRHRRGRHGRVSRASPDGATELFEYEGAPDAQRVLILMGSGGETARETVKVLAAQGEKVGVLQVRLFRPFSAEHFLAALPTLGRMRSPCSSRPRKSAAAGEPLYLDVIRPLAQAVASGGVK